MVLCTVLNSNEREFLHFNDVIRSEWISVGTLKLHTFYIHTGMSYHHGHIGIWWIPMCSHWGHQWGKFLKNRGILKKKQRTEKYFSHIMLCKQHWRMFKLMNSALSMKSLFRHIMCFSKFLVLKKSHLYTIYVSICSIFTLIIHLCTYIRLRMSFYVVLKAFKFCFHLYEGTVCFIIL